MTIKSIATTSMTVLSLVTALGVFSHDSRIDKATGTALSGVINFGLSPVKTVSGRYTDFVSGDAHSHPDHNAAGQSLLSSFLYQSPSIAPKRKSHHRDLQRMTAPLRHAFDNANLPVLD